ncbi:hypothetical protein Q666_01695 [Marinobacter sp. ES-1]|nr:hypothetical protein Q666_01695 [Marinobacter sp. ES-1]
MPALDTEIETETAKAARLRKAAQMTGDCHLLALKPLGQPLRQAPIGVPGGPEQAQQPETEQ